MVTNNSKISYYKSTLDYNLPITQLWKRLNKIGISKNTSECCINPEIMNDFFLQCNGYVCNSDLLFNGDEFNLTAFTPNYVYKSVIAIKSNAVGLDAVNLKFIKLILPALLPVLTLVFTF